MKFYAPFPPPDLTNPFQLLLAIELKKGGWDYSTFNLKFTNLLKYRNSVSLLYFHWPEFIWRSSSKSITGIKGLVFIFKILFAKILGYKLVWSAHNVLPHNYNSKVLEVIMRKFILSSFDLIIGHAYNTKQELEKEFRINGKKYIEALHGHYDNFYQEVGKYNRESLGISAEKKIIYLKAGGKLYQGDDLFIENFLKHSNSNQVLIVSGHLSEKFKDEHSFKKLHYIKGFVSNGELADLVKLCDYFALPYTKITTSGAYFLAVTFKKPIIAPNLPFFVLHTLPGTAVLYEHNLSDIGKVFEKINDENLIDSNQLEKVREKFSWANASEIIVNDFNTL